MLPPPHHVAKSRGHTGPILLCISREFDTTYFLLEINASLNCGNTILFWVSSSLTGCLLLNSFLRSHFPAWPLHIRTPQNPVQIFMSFVIHTVFYIHVFNSDLEVDLQTRMFNCPCPESAMLL